MKEFFRNKYSWPWTVLCFCMALAVGMNSCIENDIPYPTVRLQITALQFDGQMGNAVIDNDECTVTVELADSIDLRKVTLRTVAFTEEKVKTELVVDREFDLSKPLVTQLSLYDTERKWTIVAKQNIERIFKVENQIGKAQFSLLEHYATVMVPEEVSLKRIKLLELKLAPKGSTINGSVELPQLKWEYGTNFARSQVTVSYKDIIKDEVWTLFVFKSESSVRTVAADGWTKVAWLYGQGAEDKTNGFEMKEAGSEVWTRVDNAYITHNGGEFMACVPHLKEQTEYICRAFSNDEVGNELTFTTGKSTPLPGGSFDEWHKDPAKQKIWNPWKEGETQYWDSGNEGATTLGESITVPTEETQDGQGLAAMLQSKFVGIGSIGKFAAGNMFLGKYVKTDGTNGILSFGKPFVERPTKLKGYYRYKTAPITDIPNESTPEDHKRFAAYLGKPDTCFIYAALGDWNEPVEIRTRPSNRKLFEKNDPHVIAYTELTSGTNSAEYIPFELEFEYRATDRVPKYLVLVCSTSKYGDFFTGGDGAVMWIDDFSLEYDY